MRNSVEPYFFGGGRVATVRRFGRDGYDGGELLNGGGGGGQTAVVTAATFM